MILMARRRAQLTQRELASRLGCRQATIARWERGDRQPAFSDVQDVATACGLQVDAHLLPEDRSWWPQIAAQLRRKPAERVRQLASSKVYTGSMALLEALSSSGAQAIVIGELAGALHGWPLTLSGEAIELCAPVKAMGALLASLGVHDSGNDYGNGHQHVRAAIVETPMGTSGYTDLARSATEFDVGTGRVRVAGLVDLLRIADASPDPDRRRHALACGAVLDVQRAQREVAAADVRTDEQRISAWLSQQIPVT